MLFDVSTPASVLSTCGLPVAFAIAFVHVLVKARRSGRARWRTAWRVLLLRRVWLHPSTLLDFQYVVLLPFVYSMVFGYILLTGYGVTQGVCEGLNRWFGPRAPVELPFFVKVLVTLGLYLAFEFSYWLDHFLSHKVAFLWEFHKVHHSAAVLTPFANWRVHPMDTVVYSNILSIIAGSATGVVQYFAGEEFALSCGTGTGILFAVYMALWGHLQHSQFWMPCTGLAGRLVLSPAHHQIHHSRNPIHFDKNFGASLGLWDWLFGTLHIPQWKNERLRFGTEGDAHLKSLVPSVLYPFAYAVRRLLAMLPRSGPAEMTEPLAAASPAITKG